MTAVNFSVLGVRNPATLDQFNQAFEPIDAVNAYWVVISDHDKDKDDGTEYDDVNPAVFRFETSNEANAYIQSRLTDVPDLSIFSFYGKYLPMLQTIQPSVHMFRGSETVSTQQVVVELVNGTNYDAEAVKSIYKQYVENTTTDTVVQETESNEQSTDADDSETQHSDGPDDVPDDESELDQESDDFVEGTDFFMDTDSVALFGDDGAYDHDDDSGLAD